jgi:bifunctional UDP-N-acetylglucosamine pyrophosphorylase/glucosamine-1-phosphate N-acetyltransferase
VTIKGNIILEEWALLKSGSYIEWNVYIEKNTTIGPNAYIRENTLIRENCHIGNAVEIKNSTIGANTHIAHLSYVWDSVIGDHVNIWCGFITANLRHDSENIKCMVKKKLVDTKLKKFWVIIWDYAKIGINNSTYPGRIINNNTFTRPGTIIQ